MGAIELDEYARQPAKRKSRKTPEVPSSVYEIEQWVAYIKAAPSAKAAEALSEMIRERIWDAGRED